MAELAGQPQREKLLLVLTDGKPNDVDHYERRFAVEDTRNVVREGGSRALRCRRHGWRQRAILFSRAIRVRRLRHRR